MKNCKLENVIIGAGRPKICARLIGANQSELISEAKYFASSKGEIAEWRLDFFQDSENVEELLLTAKKIHNSLNGKPLMVSYRSQGFIGEVSLASDMLMIIYKKLIVSGFVHCIDLSFSQEKDFIKEAICYAHEHDVAVNITGVYEKEIMKKDEMVELLIALQNLGGDIVSLAIEPKTNHEVLLLLAAIDEMKQQYAEVPVVGIASTNRGTISRIAGETFGSALTYGAAMKASDYGQLSVDELYMIINLLHMNGLY